MYKIIKLHFALLRKKKSGLIFFMSKAKPGEFALHLDLGIFDLVSLRNDKIESAVLDELKNDLLRQGKFTEPKQGKICWNSVAAFLMYLESVMMINDMNREQGEELH